MDRSESLGTFSLLFDELSDGACVTNGRGDILYMNPAAERLLDLPFSRARGVDFCELLCGHLVADSSPECLSECPLRHAYSDKKAVTFVGRHGLKEGFQWEGEHIRRFKRWKDLRVRCLKLPSGAFDSSESEKHLTLIEDISEKMELVRRKEGWRSMVAHDLRAPLTSILGTLACIDEIPAGRPLTPGEKDLIGTGVKAGRRMLELLNDHLDLAKLDAGKMPVLKEDLALEELVADCVKEASVAAAEKKIDVDVVLPADLRARADRGLLFRVLQNLLSNAVKFTPPGGKVKISGGAEKRIWLAISDTGIGIPEEELPYLFDRFHQVEARSEGRIKGTGLGLAFCLEALKAMGGGISVRSKPGKGSEFTVQLPNAGGDPGM